MADECRAVRTAVGLLNTSGYAKYEFSGTGAEDFLNRMLTNRMPAGRAHRADADAERSTGKLIGDFTVAPPWPDTFHVFGSGPAEQYHMRWWEVASPRNRALTIRSLRTSLVGLSVAGPKSRALLAKLSGEDLSSAAFPFMSYRRMDIGMVPAFVGRISFTGDLGYELWISPDYQMALYDLLLDRGRRVRHQACRPARVELDAPGKEFWHLGARIPTDLRAVRGRARPLRQLQEGRFHRP